MRLSFVHEESQRSVLAKAERSPTTIMVPSRQYGHRLRSTPVIFSSRSLADSTAQWGKAGSRSRSLRHWGSSCFLARLAKKPK